MSMIAFNFTNISAERRVSRVAKYSIKNSTNIIDIKEMPLGKQKALLFVFKNTVEYEPGVGSITLTGDVLFLSNDEEAKKVVGDFAKTKKVDAKYSEAVYNTILSRATVQSLVLARDVGLPAPIQMPRVKAAPAGTAAPAKAAATAPKKK
jgi:hypothetical protein